MKIRRSSRSTEGTTLVETILATLVLGVIAVALMGSFSYGFFVMQLTRENQRATQILLEKVETIRLYRWDQVLAPNFIPATFTDVYDPQAPVGSQGTVYTGTVAVANYPFNTSYKAELRELVVTLTWTTSRNYARTRTLSTLIAKDGLQNYVY